MKRSIVHFFTILGCSLVILFPIHAQEDTQRATILFAGDLMMHLPQVQRAELGNGIYSFGECFQYVAPVIQQADLAVANFETTIGDPPYTGYPLFRSPEAYLWSIQSAGFDLMLTANNHCCDRGRTGMERTLMAMDLIGMRHVGTYPDSDSRFGLYPLLVEVNGIRVVFLNATYSTNGMPVPEGWCVNMLDTMQIKEDIAFAKTMQPDVIVAYLHWGWEYDHDANREQKRLAHWLLDCGVDHIIGSHPHVIQPFGVYQQQHLVAFSLGNFLSNQAEPNRATGLMLQMHLKKDERGTRLVKVDPIYTWVSRPEMSGRKQYYIYPLDYPDSLLNASEIRFLNQVKKEIRTKY